MSLSICVSHCCPFPSLHLSSGDSGDTRSRDKRDQGPTVAASCRAAQHQPSPSGGAGVSLADSSALAWTDKLWPAPPGWVLVFTLSSVIPVSYPPQTSHPNPFPSISLPVCHASIDPHVVVYLSVCLRSMWWHFNSCLIYLYSYASINVDILSRDYMIWGSLSSQLNCFLH